MKKKIEYLRLLCPGKLTIAIDEYKRFGETAEQAIESDTVGEYRNITGDILSEMITRNTIIRVECFPAELAMIALCIHWDLEKALDGCIKQIKSAQMQVVAERSKINAN